MSPGLHGPERTCLGCRATLERDALVRYVVTPAGAVTVDYRKRLPGRGAYTCISRTCLAAAVQKRQFSRAFHREGVLAEVATLASELTGQIAERIFNLLGMARKSRQVLSGGSLVFDALHSKGQPALIILAEDISTDIAKKIAHRAEACGVPLWHRYDKELLGRLLGKEERSVVAVQAGPLAEAIKTELFRLEQIAGEC